MTQDPTSNDDDVPTPKPIRSQDADDDADLRRDITKAIEDLSSEVAAPVRPPHLAPYSPDRDRERVRGRLALGSAGLIAILSAGAIALVLMGHPIDEVMKLYGFVVTPLITLTGGIVGFYFGAQNRRE